MYQDLCRLCAKYSVRDKDLKLFERRHRTILTQIKDVTGVMLKLNRDLPKLICADCVKSLKAAHQFRETVLKAQIVFKTKLPSVVNKREQIGQTAIEATEFVQVRYVKIEKDQNNACTTNVEEKEITIKDSLKKEETLNESYTSEINALDISSSDEINLNIELPQKNNDEYADVTPSNYFSNEDGDRLSDDVSSEDDAKVEAVHETRTQSNKKIGRPRKTHKNIKNKKQNNYPSISRENKAKKRRKDTEDHSNVYICDQCGNHFTCRHHFKLHLRRHTGDKQCACELCPDKFFTSSELRRHMRKHTGERPFACKFCERRFTDYSTRIKHERTHTNERPFTCSQCSKSFTTSYILKNHMLTHTGERHFKCEVCVKAFTRRTHLVVHFRSIMHKQAVEKGKQINPQEEHKPIIASTNTSIF